MRVLAGVLPATGTIRIDDTLLTQLPRRSRYLPARERRPGYVAQQDALFVRIAKLWVLAQVS